jgi:hypothetical protein
VDYLVVIRDADLVRVGQISPESLRLVPRFNDVGEWELTVPLARSHAEKLREPGAGVLIHRGNSITGTPLMSGPVGERTITLGDNGWTLNVKGPDDLVWLASRLAYPNPGRSATAQSDAPAVAYDRRYGTAESVIKGYVNDNAGPGALLERRVLTVETDAARGGMVAGVARMEPLLDLIRPLAETAGLGFTVVQVGGVLQFRVFEPADRTATVRLAPHYGNLREVTFTERAPTISHLVVGAAGEGAGRDFSEATDADAITAWPRWRVERFVDKGDVGSPEELEQGIAEELLGGGPQTTLALAAKDTTQARFGVHYNVGDKLRVEPFPGQVITDVLREVEITWATDEGEDLVSHVGSSDATGTPALIRLVRDLQQRARSSESVE